MKKPRVISILLFKELDKQQTCERVKRFLTKDLDRLILMSGHKLTDISSPELSLAPGHSSANHAEDEIINGINAGAMVMAVHETIHHCPEPSRTILLEKYIEHKPSFVVSHDIYLGHSRFADLLNHALLEFADGFDYWQRQFDCKPLNDLHVYK